MLDTPISLLFLVNHALRSEINECLFFFTKTLVTHNFCPFNCSLNLSQMLPAPLGIIFDFTKLHLDSFGSSIQCVGGNVPKLVSSNLILPDLKLRFLTNHLRRVPLSVLETHYLRFDITILCSETFYDIA